MLTRKQFEVLACLAERGGASQRRIAERIGMSVGTVNKTIGELRERGLTDEEGITEAGFAALEPYRVKRAIFIAAGFGSRLVPITLNTPKPLVRVKGQRIIDSLLDAVISAGIPEIYIVRGYLGEQFDQLLYKYPSVRFIENAAYNEANNILSVLCAGKLVENAYILEADLLLRNPSLIRKYQYETNYLGIPVKKTDDWCFFTENGIIKNVTVGGVNCHQMVGISYWTKADGERLSEDVRAVYASPGGKERYWDQVALEYCKTHYTISVRECTSEDVTEIDTFKELKAIDKTYDVK